MGSVEAPAAEGGAGAEREAGEEAGAGIGAGGGGDTDVLLPEDVLLPGNVFQPGHALLADSGSSPIEAAAAAAEMADEASAVASADGNSLEQHDRATSQQKAQPATSAQSPGKFQHSLKLPHVQSAHSSGNNTPLSGVVTAAGKTPAQLRQEASALDAERDVARQQHMEAEKALQELLESGAPRAQVDSAQDKARAMRQASEALRINADVLTAAAMRLEDEEDAQRVHLRVGAAQSAAGSRASAASEWQKFSKVVHLVTYSKYDRALTFPEFLKGKRRSASWQTNRQRPPRRRCCAGVREKLRSRRLRSAGLYRCDQDGMGGGEGWERGGASGATGCERRGPAWEA